jgi:hypothetical protein
MISTSFNDLGIFTPSTPHKRKLSEERDDDVIVTPSSSYDEDNARDSDGFVSTPCPASFPTPCESPVKRRKTSISALDHSKFSPPLMPRFKYRPSTVEEQNSRSLCYVPGRPILDLFSRNREQHENDNDNDLSFLAIPTPTSTFSEVDNTKIPSFGLSPRTTVAPIFPRLLDSRRLFVGDTGYGKDNFFESRRPMLPTLRMRPQKQRLGNKPAMEELSLPTLVHVTAQGSRQERRSPLPAATA